MTDRHRTHPSRWEAIAWTALEALGITLCWFAIVAGVYAASVLASRVWG